MPAWAFRGSGGKKGFALFFLTSIRIHLHTTLFATSTCGANVCKWAFCTTTSFQLRDYTGCIRHVFALGQCSMVTIGGCGSILRALGVSQILVFVARPRGEPGRLRRHVPGRAEGAGDGHLPAGWTDVAVALSCARARGSLARGGPRGATVDGVANCYKVALDFGLLPLQQRVANAP
jgi:hypothetical protein